MSQSASGASRFVERWGLLGLAMVLTLLASVLALRFAPPSPLFELGNLVGPTTQSLLRGDGLTACTEAMGTPGNPICFHSGRMPMASMVVALGIEVLGDHSLRVGLFKTLLFLVPVEFSMWLVWRRVPRSMGKRLLTVLLLLVPFGMTAFLADVVNLQVEEGYAYSLMALAVTILLFCCGRGRESWLRGIVFAVSIGGLYLTKSSMGPAVIVLLVSYLAMERRGLVRAVVAALVLLAPMEWALYQHHASGRYTLGTSLDGMNLHKGNNAEFLQYYPPSPGETIDGRDASLNRGLQFGDEWSFNDYHERAAVTFMRNHPDATLRGLGRKAWMIFLSISKLGSSESHGSLRVVETAGQVVFRVIFWIGILGATYLVFRPQGRTERAAGDRAVGLVFLSLVAAVALPYLLGFAYTRHVSVLIYPSVLMCCWFLQRNQQSVSSQAGAESDAPMRK